MKNKQPLEYKAPLELLNNGEKLFLDFWNWENGDDYCVEIKDGKLFRKGKEISLATFVKNVEKRIKVIFKT